MFVEALVFCGSVGFENEKAPIRDSFNNAFRRKATLGDQVTVRPK